MRQTTFPGCVPYHRSLRLGQNIILCCDNSLSNNLHPSYTELTPILTLAIKKGLNPQFGIHLDIAVLCLH